MAVSPEFVDQALCACKEHLSNLAHMDIDKQLEAPLYLSPEGWSLFLQRYYQVIQLFPGPALTKSHHLPTVRGQNSGTSTLRFSVVRTSCSSCGLWCPR